MDYSIFDHLNETRPVYCHVWEGENVYELTSFLDELWENFSQFSDQAKYDFLSTLNVYYWPEGEGTDAAEAELYAFDIAGYILSDLLSI